MGLDIEEFALDEADAFAHPRGDEFAVWVSPHLAVLSAVAAQHIGRDEAADVVQEALLRAWRRWGTYSENRGSARTWLLAILIDQVRRYRTRHLGHWRTTDTLPSETTSGPSGDRLDLENAVRLLSRRQQEVVALFYLADLSVDEVAVVLGISAGATKAHLSAARAGLRRVFER